MEVVRIDRSIANIFLFKINILSFSESIRLSSKLTRMEADDKIELEEIFILSCLLTGQSFSSQKIFEFFVIYDNINGKGGTF